MLQLLTDVKGFSEILHKESSEGSLNQNRVVAPKIHFLFVGYCN